MKICQQNHVWFVLPSGLMKQCSVTKSIKKRRHSCVFHFRSSKSEEHLWMREASALSDAGSGRNCSHTLRSTCTCCTCYTTNKVNCSVNTAVNTENTICVLHIQNLGVAKLQHIPSSACSSCYTTNFMVCKWSRSSKTAGPLPVWYKYAASNLDNSEKTVCCKVCNGSVFASDPDIQSSWPFAKDVVKRCCKWFG